MKRAEEGKGGGEEIGEIRKESRKRQDGTMVRDPRGVFRPQKYAEGERQSHENATHTWPQVYVRACVLAKQQPTRR